MNFSKNLVLYGFILQVEGFMDCIVHSNSSTDTGLSLLKDAYGDFGGLYMQLSSNSILLKKSPKLFASS